MVYDLKGNLWIKHSPYLRMFALFLPLVMLHSFDMVSVVVLQVSTYFRAVDYNLKAYINMDGSLKHCLNPLCFYVWDGSSMDGWIDGLKVKSEDSLLHELTTRLLSVSILSLFPTFSLNISSPPTCSHTERGINPSHFHYLSLSLSIALSATSSLLLSTNRIHLL